jgi:aspartate aminotransferase
MHPAMIKRMTDLHSPSSPFLRGTVKYTPTVGVDETRQAFLNIIASSGFSTTGLKVQITEGGSQAMELIVLGVCGPAGSTQKPLLIIDPTYTNYTALARRLGRKTVSVRRRLQDDGSFSLPEYEETERMIKTYQPGGLLLIPYDNPTGQLYTRAKMMELAHLCVKYNLWMISDEAYRELNYTDSEMVSIWGLSDREVPGLQGRRISVESASKVWNACGLRIGALVTDNEEFHRRAVAENTANLCPNAIGQYIFGALAQESHDTLQAWYQEQRRYYQGLMDKVSTELEGLLPDILVSKPSASIYTVLDVREIVPTGFNAVDFVLYCSRQGRVDIEGAPYTLLVAPMSGFYDVEGDNNPGLTQMRIAYVAPPEQMERVPVLFSELLRQYSAQR